MTGQLTFKFTQNWSVLGVGALRSRGAARSTSTALGLGYIDDCFAISLNYITDYNYSGTTTTDNRVLLVINLRTIGGTSFSQGINRTEHATTGVSDSDCSECDGPRGRGQRTTNDALGR